MNYVNYVYKYPLSKLIEKDISHLKQVPVQKLSTKFRCKNQECYDVQNAGTELIAVSIVFVESL